MVKAFAERDILNSIELRGVLEGMAARFAAERGVSARDLEPLKESLAELDELVTQDPVSVEAFSSYVTMNARFHALLTELSRSPPLIRQIDRASALPFASPSGFVMAQSVLPEAHQILIIATGPSPHCRRRDRKSRRRAGGSGDARACPPCRAKPAAGAAQPNPSRSVAGVGAVPLSRHRSWSEPHAICIRNGRHARFTRSATSRPRFANSCCGQRDRASKITPSAATSMSAC